MELNDIKSLKHMLDFAAGRYGGNTFMLYKQNGGLAKKTYDEFKAASDAFSRMLEAEGLQGCHVAVVGPTCFEWISTYFGTVNSNSVILPLAANETDEMNSRLCEFADADVLVFDKKHESLYHAVKNSVPRVKRFISLDGGVVADDVDSLDTLLRIHRGAYTYEPDPDVLCTLLFTSGTTGFPKAVMLTHKNLVSSAMSVNEPCHAVRVFSCLPISHAYCFTTNFTKVIFRGATVCVNDSLANLLADIRLFSPSSIVCVPQIANKLMGGALRYAASKPDMSESDAVSEFLGHSEKIISGGAPLEAALNARYTKAGMMVLNGYGMTECSPIIANNAVVDHRDGSVGKPIPCMQVRIEKGEIQVRGDGVMLGYYKNPDATKEAFTEDGWFRTGDLGRFDDDGYLYITGRCKNLILLDNGENVSAEYLEEQFAHEPMVQEVVCYGENGAIAAEFFLNAEYVKEHDIADMDAAMIALLGRVNAKLATHQRIASYSLRSIPFERTASSKIKRTDAKPAAKAAPVAPKTAAEKRVCEAVRELLDKDEVGTNENFFAVGGDSLSATELAVTLHVSTQLIYDNPFLGALAAALEKEENADDRADENINDILLETAGKGERPTPYRCVLLTGGTGFLGIHVLRELVEKNVKIYVLLRSRERFQKMVSYYFDSLDLTNVTLLEGDIEKEKLGLHRSTYEQLLAETDAVFHTAANVRHAGDYAELEKTNVQGTMHIIDFCRQAGAVLHHTSTVSVHGAATVVETRKNAIFDENTLYIGQHFADNVYIHSKYRAEEAVLLARREGLRANIYRIGNLTWRAADGKFQRNNEDNGFLHRIHAMLKLGLVNDNMDKYPMDLTPVDECAHAFVELAFAGYVNEIYHLMNPQYLATKNLFRLLDVPYRRASTLETVETVFANTGDRDIHVYMFYMLISGRSANVETRCDFTLRRFAACGLRWSAPDKEYLTLGDGKGHCLAFAPYTCRPPRETGGTMTPIQKLALGALQKTELSPCETYKGENALCELAARIAADGVQKPLLLVFGGAPSIPGIHAFITSLGEGLPIYEHFSGEPTLGIAATCLALYNENGCDGIVAVGGGSVLDCAKMLALLASNPGCTPDDVCGFTAEPMPAVPFYAVPTTAGTGSESTLFAVLTDEAEQKKVAYLSDRFLPRAVALDAALTTGLSPATTAATGIDALSHAAEAYCSLFASSFPEDRDMAPLACKKIFAALPVACAEPQNLAARQEMLEAAYEAGLAFRRISTGYIHAVAHRLGELYHIPHGVSIAAAFTPVLRAYLPYAAAELKDLAVACALAGETDDDMTAAQKFIAAVDELVAALGLGTSIQCNPKDIEEIVLRAQEEAKVQGYPRPFSDERLATIVASIFSR